MGNKNVNLLWKSFKGIRKLNSINSDVELGAEIASGVRLSKEKSGQSRSIKSSGWFNDYATLNEPIFRLFAANMSGYEQTDQLLAFTKSSTNINVWLVEDNTGILSEPVKIAEFPLKTDVYDVATVQFGDRLATVCAFGDNYLGFIVYSATELSGWNAMESGWFYRNEAISEATTNAPVTDITQVRPFGARLAINGRTTYTENSAESIYGIWFSEAGQPLNFTMDYLTEAQGTSAFYIETGEKINALVEYHGLTALGKNRSYNIYGTSDYTVNPLSAKGVVGNAAFSLNGKCAYVDSYSDNIFTIRDNIDSTIGFDEPIGDDIQDYLADVSDVSINAIGRRVRMTKRSGECLVFDVDIGEWTTEILNKNARVVTFLNKELYCDQSTKICQITDSFGANSTQIANSDGYYSHYKSNLIWLDSQSSVKSHIYPLAIILEPQTANDFFVKFTTDRGLAFESRITRGSFGNIAIYSESDDDLSGGGSYFVESDDDLSGGVFFSIKQNELLVTVDRPPFWRYLQIEIYTTSPEMQFNISGIEAKNTFITDELLDC